MNLAEKQLEKDRKGLLLMTAKNRLLSLPLKDPRAKFIAFDGVEEDQLFGEMVGCSQVCQFSSQASTPLPYPTPRTGRVSTEQYLPSTLTGAALHSKLLSLSRDARTAIEERGINILHLTLGMVSWVDEKTPRKLHQAPLILIPVKLIKGRNSKQPFTLRWSQEDVELNPCLELKIDQDLKLGLPEFKYDSNEFLPSEYFQKITKLLKKEKDWNVSSGTIGLGLFDFKKLLMYRDLDPEKWPTADHLLNPAVRSLLGDPGAVVDCVNNFKPEFSSEELDDSRRDHVMDADESQSEAINMVRKGANLIIQGPPGTGKSQTIANIIATAVLDGKSVLFICEKSAALDVVKKRLENIGLGSLCLELHSGKATKKAVQTQIRNAWEQGSKLRSPRQNPIPDKRNDFSAELDSVAAELNRPVASSGLTPHEIMGRLARIVAVTGSIPRVNIPQLQDLSSEDFQLALHSALELQNAYNSIIDPQHHPWSAVDRITPLHHTDVMDLGRRIRELLDLQRTLQETSSSVATSMGFSNPADLLTTAGLLSLAESSFRMPPDATNGHIPKDESSKLEIRNLVDEVSELWEIRNQLDGAFDLSALDGQTDQDCETVRTYGDALFKYFMPSWWTALGNLNKHALKPLPEDHGKLLKMLNRITRFRRITKKVRAAEDIGNRAFGRLWRGVQSDPEQLCSVLDWHSSLHAYGVDEEGVARLALLNESESFGKVVSALRDCFQTVGTELESLLGFLEATTLKAFGFATKESIPFSLLIERLSLWDAHLLDLQGWSRWRFAVSEASRNSLGQLAEQIEAGKVPGSHAVSALENSYYRDLLDSAWRERPALDEFRSERHDSLIEAFRKTDKDALRIASQRVLEAYLSRLPEIDSGVPEVQCLKGEFNRIRGHLPVRSLLSRTGETVRAIKPVFMMSTLTAAQYLEPGSMKFDLLVIDEASQIQPVDALGSIARSKQHVVVGDSRQLPPTSFFSKMLSGEDPDRDEDAYTEDPGAGDMESILSLCAARHFRQTMLRWHFRSRHETLIGFSNERFYNGNLVIAPSPDRNPVRRGLRHIHVPEGVYLDRENRVEAERIAEAVLEHSKNSPDLTLGIVTFSQKQQLLVDECISDLANKHRCLADFKSSHGDESLFVKNIENVQGDERDVIFISFGYGRDSSGTFAMRFGPAGQSGGERRLNVMITRAKERCILFSSVKSSEFRIDGLKADSPVHAIKGYMEFAERCSANTIIEATTQEPSLSPQNLAAGIRHSLHSHGFTCRELPETNGICIDLAVEDPQDPTRLLMAILLDGPGYSSLKNARDRDRLFHAILHSNGWEKTYRVWSIDWMTDSEREISHILEILRSSDSLSEDQTGESAEGAPGNEYVMAVKSPGLPAFLKLKPTQLADEIHRILQIEGPIHLKQLNERLKEFFAIPRMDEATKGKIFNGIEILKADKRCTSLGECYGTSETITRIRDRSHLSPKPDAELIPQAEIRLAAEQVLGTYPGVGESHLVQAAAELLGYQRVGQVLEGRLTGEIRSIKSAGRIRLQARLG